MRTDIDDVSTDQRQVNTDTISESAFLLTELRYTLGQLHVQLGDLNAETRATAMSGARSVDQVLDDMLQHEGAYQGEYTRMLGTSPPAEEGDKQFRGHAAFERKRAQTVALLEQAGENWSSALLDTVKRQVAEDRRNTTELAEWRQMQFETDQRPDPDQPLTPEPEPESLSL